MSLFSRAFEIASQYREEAVLKYAISRVQNENVHADGWRAFHNCVLDAVGADSSTIGVALGILFEVSRSGCHTVPVGPLAEVFEGVVNRHAPRGAGSEVAWALWGALAWSVPLSKEAATLVSGMDDNVVAILALDAETKGLFPAGSLNQQHWASAVGQPDVLSGQNWLLAHEANFQGWLACPAVAASPDFSAMLAGGVSFYDSTKNVPQFPSAARGLPGGFIPDYYA